MTARDRTVLMVVVALAVLGAFWFVVVSPRHKEAQAAEETLTQARDRLETANASVVAAESAKRGYARDYSTIARLGKAVPIDDEVPSLVYQLSTAADSHSIDFRSIKLSSTAAPVAAPPAAQPQPPAANTPTTSTQTAPAPGAATATPTAAPATNAGTAALPPGAVVGPASFPLMPFSFVFDGSFFDMSSFLGAIDRFTTVRGEKVNIRGRLLTIDGISIKASRKGFPKINATIKANAYLLPSGQGVTAGATASAPPASTSGSSTPTPPAAAAAAR